MPGQDPQDRSGNAEDARLHDDGPAHLADRHPGRPQHADLADPLEDVHRERVDDAQRGDDDRDDRQRVEQPEDSAERGIDGARDTIERIGFEGQRPGRLLAAEAGHPPRGPARSGSRRRPRRRRRAGSSRRSSRRAPPRPPRPGSVRSAIAATRRSSDLPLPSVIEKMLPTPSFSRSASARGQDRPASLVERGQRILAVAGQDPQPPVLEEVLSDDGRGVRPDALERHLERGDRADAGDAVDRGELVDRIGLLDQVDRPDRCDERVAGDHLGQPGGRRGRATGPRRRRSPRSSRGPRSAPRP